MKILNLTADSQMYTSNAYLVMGTWNTIEDVNTLIDVGSDPIAIQKIENTNTGLGKKKIDQVILTHSHSDHTAILSRIRELYHPCVCAFNSHLEGVDVVLRDGDSLRIGEQYFEVFHITAHSYDSVCLLGEQDGILFSGDTSFPIEFENELLTMENEPILERLKNKKVKLIYPGHGLHHAYPEGTFHPSLKNMRHYLSK